MMLSTIVKLLTRIKHGDKALLKLHQVKRVDCTQVATATANQILTLSYPHIRGNRHGVDIETSVQGILACPVSAMLPFNHLCNDFGSPVPLTGHQHKLNISNLMSCHHPPLPLKKKGVVGLLVVDSRHRKNRQNH